MSAEKCFCHLNGYKVKDADARAELEAQKLVIAGLSEGATDHEERITELEKTDHEAIKYYRHILQGYLATADDDYSYEISFITKTAIEITTLSQLKQEISKAGGNLPVNGLVNSLLGNVVFVRTESSNNELYFSGSNNNILTSVKIIELVIQFDKKSEIK